MLDALRAFLGKVGPPFQLESYRVEHALEPYWMGRPAKGPYAMRMAAAVTCGLLAIFLYFSNGAPSVAVLLAGLLVAVLYPFIAAQDWRDTEYLLTPDVIISKPGAFSKGLRVHHLNRFASVEEETPRFASWLGYRNLHLRAAGEDGEPPGAASEDARIANLPTAVAAGFLDVLDVLAEEPETVMSSPERPAELESP